MKKDRATCGGVTRPSRKEEGGPHLGSGGRSLFESKRRKHSRVSGGGGFYVRKTGNHVLERTEVKKYNGQ